MTNTVLLEEKISQSGLRKKFLAERMGLSPYGLANKISGKTDFKTEEVAIICGLLKITSLKEKEEIFFASKVD